MGGGNSCGLVWGTGGKGLSPRGRGKLRGFRQVNDGIRSIPAWAGETNPLSGNALQGQVYPRVGGGNHPDSITSPSNRGLSPRGRGKRRPEPACHRAFRSIPAWAGETMYYKGISQSSRVYPRVGGGNGFPGPAAGSPPGLSPRGRGKQRPLRPGRLRRGSIPAWAGETPNGRPPHDAAFPVYPRVGGGNLSVQRPVLPGRSLARVYPRVGGGNRLDYRSRHLSGGLSPRGRGKRFTATNDCIPGGSIPAWAGETEPYPQLAGHKRVYPRVGGGNAVGLFVLPTIAGLSPRGRGKPGRLKPPCPPRRSIPAWAGETGHYHH